MSVFVFFFIKKTLNLVCVMIVFCDTQGGLPVPILFSLSHMAGWVCSQCQHKLLFAVKPSHGG